MSLNHNQMAYVAIVSTLIFGSLFVGVSGFFQTSENVGGFESAVEEDIRGESELMEAATDSDGDGLSISWKKPNTEPTPMIPTPITTG